MDKNVHYCSCLSLPGTQVITRGGHAVQGVVAVSAPAYLESAPFVAPDAPGLGLAVRQPGAGAALRPGDGRVTGVSYSGGLLWAGAVLLQKIFSCSKPRSRVCESVRLPVLQFNVVLCRGLQEAIIIENPALLVPGCKGYRAKYISCM